MYRSLTTRSHSKPLYPLPDMRYSKDVNAAYLAISDASIAAIETG